MKIAIVGGGVAGLTAAYKICKLGGSPIVIEKRSKLGGLASSLKIKNYYIEEFYHHVFKNDKGLLELLSELGIKDKLIWNKARSGSIDRNGIYELTSPMDLIRYKPLTFIEKLRLGFFVLKIKKIKNVENYDKVNAKQWIVENTCQTVFKKFFEPMLRGKYGSFADDVSAAWFIYRIALRSDRALSGETLGYMRGGFQTLIDKLREEIKSLGGQIITNANVKNIEVSKKKKRVVYTQNKKQRSIVCDAIISTVPIPEFLTIYKGPSEEINKLRELKYEGSVCAILGLKRKLSDIYWLNVMDKDAPFGAIIEHTNFQPPRNYNYDRIVYLITYVKPDSQLFSESDGKMVSKYVKYLKNFFDINNSDIKWSKVVKNRYTSPVYFLNYLNFKPGHNTTKKGLFIAGLPISYPGRSINDSIKSGAAVANMVMKR